MFIFVWLCISFCTLAFAILFDIYIEEVKITLADIVKSTIFCLLFGPIMLLFLIAVCLSLGLKRLEHIVVFNPKKK